MANVVDKQRPVDRLGEKIAGPDIVGPVDGLGIVQRADHQDGEMLEQGVETVQLIGYRTFTKKGVVK